MWLAKASKVIKMALLSRLHLEEVAHHPPDLATHYTPTKPSAHPKQDQ